MSHPEQVEDAQAAQEPQREADTISAHELNTMPDLGPSASPSQHNDDEDEDNVDAEDEDDGDDAEDDEEDESDDEPVEWLASGRERRATAGRNMQTLLAAQEEDGELDLLFAEAEEEDVDFQSSEAEAAEPVEEEDSSSSSDEDDKPVDELEGEKQLQKEERAQRKATNKRKTVFKIPAAAKRSRLNDSSSPSDAAAATAAAAGAAQRPRKKSERISWLPTDIDAPLRTSSRTLSVQHKEKTIASLKDAEQRRKRQLKVLEEANRRREAKKRKPMTQAERLAEAAETEAVNLRSLHRWEEVENERIRKQQERLAQMHSRVIDGPFVRYYSGPAEWIDGHLRRIGNPNKVEELIEIDIPTEKPVVKKKRLWGKHKGEDTSTPAGNDAEAGENTADVKLAEVQPTETGPVEAAEQSLPAEADRPVTVDGQPEMTTESSKQSTSDVVNDSAAQEEKLDTTATPTQDEAPPDPSAHDIPAVEQDSSETQPVVEASEPVDAEVDRGLQLDNQAVAGEEDGAADDDDDVEMIDGPDVEVKEEEADGREDAASEAPKGPQVKETSAYQSISLHNYSVNLPAGPAILNRIMLGYDASNHSTKTTSTNCYVSGNPAQYRDPQTGVPFRGVEEFKIIRRVAGLAGSDKPVWSSLLNAYVGRALPAQGVPESFMTGKVRTPQPPPQQAAAPAPSPSAPQTRSAASA